MTVASPADEHPSLFVVIEMWGCSDIRLGGPNDEAVSGHPLHGKGLSAYQAHEVFDSAWIEDRITVNSVHPQHSDAMFRSLHHYVLPGREPAVFVRRRLPLRGVAPTGHFQRMSAVPGW